MIYKAKKPLKAKPNLGECGGCDQIAIATSKSAVRIAMAPLWKGKRKWGEDKAAGAGVEPAPVSSE